jgi:hypothetical protein
MPDKHWIDLEVDDARFALKDLMDESRDALQDKVPVGKRKLTKREQLIRFIKMTPQEHDALKQERGEDEYGRFFESQANNAKALLGDDYAATLFVEEEEEETWQKMR